MGVVVQSEVGYRRLGSTVCSMSAAVVVGVGSVTVLQSGSLGQVGGKKSKSERYQMILHAPHLIPTYITYMLLLHVRTAF